MAADLILKSVLLAAPGVIDLIHWKCFLQAEYAGRSSRFLEGLNKEVGLAPGVSHRERLIGLIIRCVKHYRAEYEPTVVIVQPNANPNAAESLLRDRVGHFVDDVDLLDRVENYHEYDRGLREMGTREAGARGWTYALMVASLVIPYLAFYLADWRPGDPMGLRASLCLLLGTAALLIPVLAQFVILHALIKCEKRTRRAAELSLR
jgi:hypothetical protein